MDDAGANWGQIAITGKRRASDEFGSSGSDLNLVPGRAFFGEFGWWDRQRLSPKHQKSRSQTRADSVIVLGGLQQFCLL